MILHGRILSARQCRDRGVIHELARDTGELMDRALARAEQLRDLHLKTYEINKLILRRPIFDEAVRVSESLMSEAPSENIFANLKT
jgi:enoyl-CoA hydratase/carnithine racemase